MNGWYHLLEYVSEDANELILLCIVIICSYIYICRKQYVSVFDPFFMSLFGSACAFTTGVYAYIKGIFLYEELFIYFVISEIMYVIGVNVFSKRKEYVVKDIPFYNDKFLYMSYYLFFVIYIIFTFCNVFWVGLPIFVVGNMSRLEMYSEGSGGIQVILNALLPVIALLGLYINFLKKNVKSKWMLRIAFLCIIINLIGNGSKSAVLPLVYILFFWHSFLAYNLGYTNDKCRNIRDALYGSVVIAIIIAFVVMSLEMDTDDMDILLQGMLTRLIAFGDIYPYYYGYNFYPSNIITDSNPLITIFGPFLQSIRVFSYTGDIADSVGLQIFQHLYNTASHYGPNPRHNVFGLVLFGPYGSVIYSFFIGLLSGYIRNKINPMGKRNILYVIYYYYIYSYACRICSDNAYGINVLLQSVIITTTIFLLVYMVGFKMKNSR